jgi:hypothetical protein
MKHSKNRWKTFLILALITALVTLAIKITNTWTMIWDTIDAQKK